MYLSWQNNNVSFMENGGRKNDEKEKKLWDIYENNLFYSI